MKRSQTEEPNDDRSSLKKMKVMPTFKLASLTDELSLVLQYLPIGGVLMFSMTCKANYEWTCNLVKNYTCKYYIGSMNNWSLTNALRQIISTTIEPKVEQLVSEIAERNGSICEISNHLIANSETFQDLYELLNIRKGDENSEPIQVETVCVIDPNDNGPPLLRKTDESNLKFDTKVKTIEGEPVGYDLKGLSIIDMTLTRTKLYKIMTKLRNLESLTLNISQEYHRPKNSRGSGRGRGGGLMAAPAEEDTTEDETGEAFDEEFIYVPLMKNLKKLVIEKGFDNDSFISEILPVCPNLEYLDFVCRESVGDDLLEDLCEYCPRMKTLKIRSYDGSTQFELGIADAALAEFLEKQPNIEVIDLEPTAFISGAIFKRLGDFPTLRSFRTYRACYNGGCAAQEEDLYFGGNANPSLEYIDIGSLFRFENVEQVEKMLVSLKKVAPNLKGWGDIGDLTNEQSNKLTELYLESLEELNVESEICLPLLAKCIKLKTISTSFEGTYENLPPIDSNPNVTKLVYPYKETRSLSLFSKIFPNVKVIEGNSRTVKYLLENKDAFPHLVHLKFDKLKVETLTKLAKLRPTLFIECTDLWKPTVSPQVFAYQWLERDESN